MTSGIGDPLAKSTAFVAASSDAFADEVSQRSKGRIRATFGSKRTTLGELVAAF
jgi:hypothetical protein